MKCIQYNSSAKTRAGEVRRVNNTVAWAVVNAGYAVYVARSVWKAAGRPKG